MLPLNLNSKKKINLLVLGAHCDDIEIGCGGTIIRLLEDYKINAVDWYVFTSDPIRKKEAITSAHFFLGEIQGKNIEVKGFRDGFLPYDAAAVKEEFEQIKSKTNPDIIFTHYRHDRHQDHRLISDLTWNTWRNHLILEYEIPKYDGDMGHPNFFVEIDNYLKIKIRYIQEAFQSQNKKHWFDDETFTALPRIRGIECAQQYAEAFYVRKIVF